MKDIVNFFKLFLICAFLFIFSMFVFEMLFHLLSKIELLNFLKDNTDFAYLGGTIVGFLTVIYYIKSNNYINIQNELNIKNIKSVFMFLIILELSMGYILDYFSYYLETWISNSNPSDISLENRNTPILLIGALIVAPFFEEIIFRGVFFKYLYRTNSFILSASISSLLFAAIHFNFIAFPGMFIGSIIYCWVYKETKSLLSCILLHFMNNLTTYILYSNDVKFILELFSSNVTIHVLLAMSIALFIISIKLIQNKGFSKCMKYLYKSLSFKLKANIFKLW